MLNPEKEFVFSPSEKINKYSSPSRAAFGSSRFGVRKSSGCSLIIFFILSISLAGTV